MVSPARGIKRLKVDNRRTRILRRGRAARRCSGPRVRRNCGRMVRLALITGARGWGTALR